MLIKLKNLEEKSSLTPNEQIKLIPLQKHRKNLLDQIHYYKKAKIELLENQLMIPRQNF